jgi:hypothetical protein
MLPLAGGLAAGGGGAESSETSYDPLTAKPGQKRRPSAGTPNVLFLMTDQQSWNALGVLNPAVKTPNLDRLAARGIVFDQAVCQSPMCIPSRYSLSTGMYPAQVGVRNNGQSIQDSRDLRWPTMFMQFAQAGWRSPIRWNVRASRAPGRRAGKDSSSPRALRAFTKGRRLVNAGAARLR